MSLDWQPSASFDIIKQRATLLKTIRQFMEDRNIMEVETPVLSHTGNTDPHLTSITTCLQTAGKSPSLPLYLNTSPEFSMKRLLASGSGAIFQIGKVFRAEELGRYHQPEFTLLEWYQPGFDHHDLMDEIEDLLILLGYENSERKSYVEVFKSCTGLDPHLADNKQLHDKAVDLGLQGFNVERRELLDFLFSHSVVPALGGDRPVFVYDFPACQAALACISSNNPTVAERFELIIGGIEIANGFHELCDANEQLKRFKSENEYRKKHGLKEIPIDHHLIEALKGGMPASAGVAVGLDRLLMKIFGCNNIHEVMTFPHDRS